MFEHADLSPDLVPGSVSRFVYGTEPQVIAEVPLIDGGTLEVHGYAVHYNRDWVCVDWNDENIQHFSCWVPANHVRRPGHGEWHGRYVAREV